MVRRRKDLWLPIEEFTHKSSNFMACTGTRLGPIIVNHSTFQKPFAVIEHYDGIATPVIPRKFKGWPIVTFNTEFANTDNWIQHFSKYGKVIHCNKKLADQGLGIFFNYWIYAYKNRVIDYKQKLNTQNSFNKKFLCLMGNRAWHKYWILQTIYNIQIYSHGYISFLNRYNSADIAYHYEDFKERFQGISSFVDDLYKNKKVIELDRTNNEIAKNDNSHEEWIYKDTSISLVAETNADSDKNALFVTEKTYKPLANCHFAIWIAHPGVVQFVRSLGFDVFDDIIDHRYDTIVNDVERFSYALKSLKRFLYTIPQNSHKRRELNNRLKKNQEKFLNYELKESELEKWI